MQASRTLTSLSAFAYALKSLDFPFKFYSNPFYIYLINVRKLFFLFVTMQPMTKHCLFITCVTHIAELTIKRLWTLSKVFLNWISLSASVTHNWFCGNHISGRIYNRDGLYRHNHKLIIRLYNKFTLQAFPWLDSLLSNYTVGSAGDAAVPSVPHWVSLVRRQTRYLAGCVGGAWRRGSDVE